MNVALNEVAAYMQKHKLGRNDTYLYISTDSDTVLRNIKKSLKYATPLELTMTKWK